MTPLPSLLSALRIVVFSAILCAHLIAAEPPSGQTRNVELWTLHIGADL